MTSTAETAIKRQATIVLRAVIRRSLLTLLIVFSAITCTVPPGTWPNCISPERGWHCEGVIPGRGCGCGKVTTRHTDALYCALNEHGAAAKFRAEHTGTISVECLPAQNQTRPNDWGGPLCSPCMAVQCKGESAACAQDYYCHALDICLRVEPVSACVASWGELEGQTVAVAFFACAGARCNEECHGAAPDECAAICKN